MAEFKVGKWYYHPGNEVAYYRHWFCLLPGTGHKANLYRVVEGKLEHFPRAQVSGGLLSGEFVEAKATDIVQLKLGILPEESE